MLTAHKTTDAAEVLAADFERDGLLVIEDCYSTAECAALMAHTRELIDKFDHKEHATVFSTGDQAHAAANYFRTSGDKIRFFLEKDALDEHGELVGDKQTSINKIGHALHDLDEQFDKFSRKPELGQIARAIGIKQPQLIQSMYIFKPPRIGGEVNCHQDSSFLYTEPQSCVGFWIALEDATIENGCLWATPGGHTESLRQRFHYVEDDLVMETLDERPLPKPDTPLEAKQGTLILLHGRLPHQSSHNTSNKSRQAYAVHVIDGSCEYLADNWLQRPELPLRGF